MFKVMLLFGTQNMESEKMRKRFIMELNKKRGKKRALKSESWNVHVSGDSPKKLWRNI